ncbi:MAG: phenylalanine--tRNA ligase beta subunit-related protein [Aggregatilineales bacterium]
MIVFQYAPEILQTYPNIVGGVIYAQGMTNLLTPPDLVQQYNSEQTAVKAKIGDTPLSEIESLSAWRKVFKSFGVDPTKYRSAAESLLRRLTKKGDIPSINMLVDIGNLVSIRYGLPVAVFDTRHIEGSVTVHRATGIERYRELDNEEVIYPEIGEVVFSDEADMVIARRWCWRQSDESASRLETTNAIITIEAHHTDGHRAIEMAMQDLLILLKKYAGGHYEHAILDAKNPAMEVAVR